MQFQNPGIVLITGIMASGKSTIAQRVAERIPRSVHLRGDVFRRMIVNGRADLQPNLSEADFDQLRLRYRLAAAAVDIYCQAGFTVVCQDIIIGSSLNEVVDMLRNWPLYVIVLCPSPEVAAERDAARGKTGYTGWTPQLLDEELRLNTPRLGLWLDTSALSVEETTDAIFANIHEAAAGLR
ncbi:MAG: AAA family ATPase [Ardenticatenaceae bacterium]